MNTDLEKTDGRFSLKCLSFQDEEFIPLKYTCQGESFVPPLVISEVPSSAKSLALIVHDPDSSRGDFTHWTLWNIPTGTTEINISTDLSEFQQGLNDFQKVGYGAPCPSAGTHHYIFELFAVDEILNLKNGATRKELEFALQNHILDTTTLVGLVKGR